MPGDPDKELAEFLSSAPATPSTGDPDAEMQAFLAGGGSHPHVTELEPVKIEGRLPPGPPQPWYERLAPALMRARADQAAGPSLGAPLSPESQAAQAEVDARNAAAEKHMRDMGSLSGMTKKVAASVAGPFMGAGGSSIPANATNAFVQQTLQSGAEDNDRSMAENAGHGLAAAGTSALLMGLGREASALGQNAGNLGNELRTHSFMTGPQRTAYKLAKGSDALSELGQDAKDAGLFKRRGLLDLIRPVTARRVADNAERVMAESGHGIGQFEDNMAARGVNPAVDVGPIVDNLQDTAKSADTLVDAAAPQDAAAATNQADRLIGLSQAQGPEGAIPFTDAVASKRDVGGRIKWNKSSQQDTYGQEAVRKATYGGLKDQISAALDDAAARGEIDPAALAQYRKNNQDFSTAATAFDPAMRMAERQANVGISAKDLLAATAMGGGVDGGLSAMAAKGAVGLPAASAARTMEMAGGALKAGGETAQIAGRAAAAPAAVSEAIQSNPGGSKADIERDANDKTKAQMKSWWQVLTGK